MSLDLTAWVLIALAMGAVGPFVALGGHGSIAWVAIRRFFGRVSRRISEVEALATSVGSRVDRLRGEIAPLRASMLAEVNATLASVQTSMLAEVQGRLDEMREGLSHEVTDRIAVVAADVTERMKPVLEEQGRKIAMTVLSYKAADGRTEDAMELDAIEATDPTAKLILKRFGRRKGARYLSYLGAVRDIDAQVHPDLHPTDPVK